MTAPLRRRREGGQGEALSRGLLSLHPRAILRALTSESPAFLAVIAYVVVEYVRPQAIFPALRALPWGEMCVLIAGVGWFADSRRRFSWNTAHALMIAYLAVIVIASVTATYPEISWRYFFDFFSWFVIYFVVVANVTSERRFFAFTLVFLLASFKMSFHGARTWAARGFTFTNWGLMGPEGPFENSGEFAAQMVVFTPIAFHFLLALRPYLGKTTFRLLMFAPLTGLMTVIGASSRGSQLAMALQVPTALIPSKRAMRGLLVASAVAAMGFLLMPAEQLERFSSAGSDDTSRQRLIYWTRGTEMFMESPLLGVGYFNFAPVFATRYPDQIMFGSAQLPHNIFVQVATDAGILGLSVFLLLIWSSFAATRKARRLAKRMPGGEYYVLQSRGLDTALVGFLVAGQFVTITYYPFFWIHLAMSVSLQQVVAGVAARTGAPRGIR